MDGVDWSSVDRDSMDWSMDGCWVNWSGVSNTLILDVSNITAITNGVSVVVYNLDPAIGQGHPVVSSHSCPIGSLVLAKVSTRVLILNTVLKSIRLGWLGVSMDWGMDWRMDDGSCMHDGSRVNGGRMEDWSWVEGGGTSRGQGSDENSSL